MTRPVLAALCVCAAALLVACGSGSPASPDVIDVIDVIAPSATPTAMPHPTPSPTPEPTATPAPTIATGGGGAGAGASSAPVRPSVGVSAFRIPRFGVAAGIEYLGTLWDGTLDSPHNPHNVGWYPAYDPPGQPGNAVFAAHVDYYPNIVGPFHDVAALGAGDDVYVTLSDGREVHYQVVRNTRYPADDVPMGYVIWPGDRPPTDEWITMITCGGEFRATTSYGAGEYLSRDVVIARRVD